MLKNYIKIAIRDIRKNFTYSFINIIGLAFGLASCLMIVLYVQHELSYDTFHPDSDRLYRVGFEVSLGSGTKEIASTSYRLAGTLKNDFPQLQRVTHFSEIYTAQVTRDENKFREPNIAFADSNFFEAFAFEFISGDPKTALNQPNQVVITANVATKYFGNTNPLGKTLQIGAPYSDDEMELVVSGVIREMPSNSHFHMNFLVSMPTGQNVFSDNLRYNWGWDSHYTYVVLPENYESEQFNADLMEFGGKYIEGDWFLKFFSQKVKDIHLYSNLNSEIEANGSITYVYVFSIVAFIILLIACINYMNLATARAVERSREVGIRKSVGANKAQLVGQFLGESIFTVSVSMLLAFALTEIALPFFNNIAGKSIQISVLSNGQLIMAFFGLAIVIGILSGMYPAFFLSSFKPVKVLKESVFKIDKRSLLLRKGLVTLQFSVSIILIAGTILVYNQLHFLRTKDLGAETEQVVQLPIQSSAILENYETIREELIQHKNIINVTSSNRLIGRDINSGINYSVLNNKGIPTSSRLSNIWVGWEFFDLYNINLIYGRSFSRSFSSDTLNHAVILNEEAVRILEMDPESAVGKQIHASDEFTGVITGVAEDFHFEALYNKIKPMVFILDPDYKTYVSIKIANQNMSETLVEIREIWKQFEPDRIFVYSFLDEDLYRIYASEERFMKVFTIFTLLALFTASLGIFGLTKFTTSQRTREIGIRKVLGANIADILRLFSTEIIRLTGIAFLIATPLAYFVMSTWLQNFAYRTSINIWIFLMAGLIAGIIALTTVAWQSLCAAIVNPIESIRNE